MFASKFFSRMGRRFRSWRRHINLRFLSPFGKLFAACARRVRVWFHKRSFRLFLQGLPALLVGLGVLALLVCSALPTREEVQLRYLEQGKAAFQAKDFALAQVCYERACQTAGDRPDLLYEMGRTAQELGQTERADLVMKQLAPPTRQGYGEAHLWNARRLLADGDKSPDNHKVAETHLLRALRGELRDRDQARWLLGDLYLQTNKLHKAEVYLSQVVPTQPLARLSLARVFALRGDTVRARQEANFVVNHFRPRLQHDIYDNRSRSSLAIALTFLEEFPEAVAVLREGWSLTKDPSYPKAIGQVYALWCEVRQQAGKADKGTKAAPDEVALLEHGLSWDPTNRSLLNRLLAILSRGGPDADQARAQMRTALAEGRSAATAHFVLGVDAARRGNLDEARLHWERSHQLAPHLPDVANNLALLLCNSSAQPDPQRALQLVELALKQAPDHPNYRDTRGRIYMKLGKWEAALADLQVVLTRSRPSPSLHRALAEVYERLRIPDMAEEHRRLADKQAPAAPGAG
jgi:tetratricopeptide (TPR) repeat protein